MIGCHHVQILLSYENCERNLRGGLTRQAPIRSGHVGHRREALHLKKPLTRKESPSIMFLYIHLNIGIRGVFPETPPTKI